jgi:hypothetical protein
MDSADDAADCHGGSLALAMRGQHHHRLGELGPGEEEPFELPAGLELIQAADRGDAPLFAVTVLPVVFDDLEIDMVARPLLAEEHGDLRGTDATMHITT